MLIELWKDTTGYRLGIEDRQYDLSPESYERLVSALETFRDSAPGEYASAEYDLQDWDDPTGEDPIV